GEISSWKAFVPGFSGKLAIEAVDRAMRGEASASPIYEGEDSVIAWMLAGPDATYEVVLPPPDGQPLAIHETYPNAHSGDYQAQDPHRRGSRLDGALPRSQSGEARLRRPCHSEPAGRPHRRGRARGRRCSPQRPQALAPTRLRSEVSRSHGGHPHTRRGRSLP